MTILVGVRGASGSSTGALVVCSEGQTTRALVLELLARGMEKRRIARELGISRARVREIALAGRGGPKRRRRH